MNDGLEAKEIRNEWDVLVSATVGIDLPKMPADHSRTRPS
jgi:hypothetical protein